MGIFKSLKNTKGDNDLFDENDGWSTLVQFLTIRIILDDVYSYNRTTKNIYRDDLLLVGTPCLISFIRWTPSLIIAAEMRPESHQRPVSCLRHFFISLLIMDIYLRSDKASYRKISQSLEATILGVNMIVSLSDLTGCWDERQISEQSASPKPFVTFGGKKMNRGLVTHQTLILGEISPSIHHGHGP